MAKSINQVILMGRLTRDPETRTTPTGKSVTSFGLAVDRFGTDNGADFFNITAWDKLGGLVEQYLKKGRRCLVQGRLSFQQWEKDGQKQSRVEVVATDVTFLDGPNSSASTESNTGVVNNAPSDEDEDDQPIDLSDIPF